MIEAPIDGLNINEQPVRDFEPDMTLNLPSRAEGFRGTHKGPFGGPLTDSLLAKKARYEDAKKTIWELLRGMQRSNRLNLNGLPVITEIYGRYTKRVLDTAAIIAEKR